MKPGSLLELMAFDVLNAEQLAVLQAFYKTNNFGGAESWLLKNHIYPVWIRKVALDPEFAGK